MDWAKVTPIRGEKRVSFRIWCGLYYKFDGTVRVTTHEHNGVLIITTMNYQRSPGMVSCTQSICRENHKWTLVMQLTTKPCWNKCVVNCKNESTDRFITNVGGYIYHNHYNSLFSGMIINSGVLRIKIIIVEIVARRMNETEAVRAEPISNYVFCLWQQNWRTLPRHYTHRQISNISRTTSQNLNVSRLVLQLSFPNPLKPWRC